MYCSSAFPQTYPSLIAFPLGRARPALQTPPIPPAPPNGPTPIPSGRQAGFPLASRGVLQRQSVRHRRHERPAHLPPAVGPRRILSPRTRENELAELLAST